MECGQDKPYRPCRRQTMAAPGVELQIVIAKIGATNKGDKKGCNPENPREGVG
jgi:hypothetical protein